MASLLFRLRGVEDDEADEVRALLAAHHIDVYETSNGRWGLGYAAIWLKDDALLSDAKAMIQDYQQQRAASAQAAYQALRQAGRHPTLWDKIKQHPLQFIFICAAIMVAATLSLLPFLMW